MLPNPDLSKKCALHRHSLRLDGHVTSLLIEEVFVDALHKIAKHNNVTFNALIKTLHDTHQKQEAAQTKRNSFASFIRVFCTVHLSKINASENVMS